MRAVLTLIAVLVPAIPATAEPPLAMECGGIALPQTVALGEDELVLNGMGLREATALGVDVYVAGLYVEERSRRAEEVLNSEAPKHLVLALVRDVEREEMIDALRTGLQKNAQGRFGAIEGRMEQMAALIPELSDGDVLSFTYLPAHGIAVQLNNDVTGLVPGADFAEAFFSIWLGPQPPSAQLRAGLLGGPCD